MFALSLYPAVALLFLFVPRPADAESAHRLQVPPVQPCAATLEGAYFPDLVPAYYVWEAFWKTALTARSDGSTSRLAQQIGISEEAMTAVVDVAERGVSRASALRAAPVPPGARPGVREPAAAERILEARDDLMRVLPEETIERIELWVNATRRYARFEFDTAGTLGPGQFRAQRCKVRIKGAEQPHLIPEAFQWETYFRFKLGPAREYRTESGMYAPKYLTFLHDNGFAIPVAQIAMVLEVADTTIARIDDLRAQPGTTEFAIADVVLAARRRLLRMLPRDSWLVVCRDADSISRSSLFDFPSQ